MLAPFQEQQKVWEQGAPRWVPGFAALLQCNAMQGERFGAERRSSTGWAARGGACTAL